MTAQRCIEPVGNEAKADGKLRMNKRYMQSRDDLAVVVSLAAALSILVSAAVSMWVWSSISKSPVTVIVERGSGLP